MLKVVDDQFIIEKQQDTERIESSQLLIDNQFLENVKKGKKLLLCNYDNSSQFIVEIMNNKKPKKKDIIPDPFQRSIYARGYQCFLTHENGKAKIIFDNHNWITFDIVRFF